MLDALSLRLLLAALVGWLDLRQQEAVAYLIEEDRILRGHMRRRIRLTDEERRRLYKEVQRRPSIFRARDTRVDVLGRLSPRGASSSVPMIPR